MRAVNEFKYGNRTFRAGELTVGDYMLSLRDFGAFMEKVLSEFNERPPQLSDEYAKAFLGILFGKSEDLRVFPTKKNDASPDDFHVAVGVFMRNMHQGFLDVAAMPMSTFRAMMDDMECILDPSKYDPKRKDKSPDRKKLRETFGWATTIKNQ